LKKKRTIDEIAHDYPEAFIKYHRGFKELHNYAMARDLPDIRELKVTLLYGDPGTGKTYHAIDFAVKNKLEYFMVPNPNNNALWFDYYDKQEVMIIDDFKAWIRYHDLLRILDPYKLQLAVKGGFTWARYKYVFITSNFAWEEWYSQDVAGYTPEAIFRRIHEIIEFRGKYGDDVTQTKIK